MATPTEPKPYSFGTTELKNISLILPSEKLEKKWATIAERPVPTDAEQETLKMLDERWGRAKQAKQYKHDIWNQSYLQYRSINYYSLIYGGFPTYWNQWGMSVFIPRTFETIESVKTQMMGRAPDFSVEPTRPSAQVSTYNIGHLMKSEYKRSKTQVEVAETVHDVNVYGTGLIRTDMVKKVENQNVMSWGKDGTILYTPTEVNVYSGVGSRRIDVYDFYPNPSPEAFKMTTMGWAFERSVVDAWALRQQYEIMAKNKVYGVTENWQYIKPGGDTTDYKYIRNEIDNLYLFRNDGRTPGNVNDLIGRVGFPSMAQRTSISPDKIELREYWENDRYIVEANGLILRDSPNPYPHKQIPYVKYSLVDMNEFWSMGYPEIMKWLQVEENLLHDQGLNNIIMSVHKMFAVNSRHLEDEGELVARPFGIIHLKQGTNTKLSDAIMPIEYNMNMGNYFEFLRMNSSNIQTVTGVSPYMTGGVTKEAKVERATVANRLSFAGQARIREISRHMEDSLVTGIVEHYIAISQFYYQNIGALPTDGLPVQIESPESNFWVKFVSKKTGELTEEEITQAKNEGYRGIIGSDDIQGRFTVVVSGGSSLPKDPEEMGQVKLAFANWASGLMKNEVDPATGQTVQTPIFDITKMAKEVAKDAFNIADPDFYLYKKESQVAEDVPPPANSEIIPPVSTESPSAISPVQ